MRNYNVSVTRTAYRSTIIPVEAESTEEAVRKALAVAGDIEFPEEHDAEYSAEGVLPLRQ